VTGAGNRRCSALIGACVLAFLLAACGSGRTISTDAVAKALRTAGFPHTKIQRHTEIDTSLSGEEDLVLAIPPRPFGDSPSRRAGVVDYRSSRIARRFFATGCWTAAELMRHRCGKLPLRFAANKLVARRICNIIFSSYNAHRDPGLTTHVHRAVHLLRSMC
jgi:hypothetical protein